MRRLLPTAVVLFVLAILGPAAVAQQGTPTASGSLLAGMGYPELHITVHDDYFEVQGVVNAGRTLIVYENAGQDSRHSLLLRLPDGLDLANPPQGESEDAPPPWFFQSTFPGFPGETLPGETSYAVVDLTPGVYLVVDDFEASFVVFGGGQTETPAPPQAAGTVELFDFNFRLPDSVAPGRQVWEITNTGEQPHELLLIHSPAPVTVEQMIEMLTSESQDEHATPVGGGPSFAEMTVAGGLGWLSPGQTGWAELDLTPGTYVALCFVFDPATGMPHAAMGMVAVFTVA